MRSKRASEVLDVDPDRQQRLQREEQPGLQGGEGDHGADRDRGAALGDRPAGEPVDQRGHDGEGHLHARHAPATGHAAAHLEVGQVRRLAREALGQLGRPAHRLAQQDAADAERLRDERAHIGQAPLALGGDALALAPDAAREPDEERQQREAEGGQAPVEGEHGDDRGQHRRHVGDDRGRRRGHDVLDAADVVGDARLRPRRCACV